MYRSFIIGCVLALILAVNVIGDAQAQDLRIVGDRFYMDEIPIKLWGVRVSSATKDQAQTDYLIAQMDDYRRHGINAITVFYQGSSGANYDPFSPDGNQIEPGHHRRMEQIIGEAAKRRMVVIVGIFYQRAPFGLRDADAVRTAVATVTRKFRPYTNIIINIANEQNSSGWQDTKAVFDFSDPERIIELCGLVNRIHPERIVGGGGYQHDKNVVIGRSPEVDVLLFDTDRPEPNSGLLYDRFVREGVKNKPIVNVELFGGWTKAYPVGVFPEELRKVHRTEVDAAVARPGLSVFLHNNPWFQDNLRYHLAGDGTEADPGVRWYFEYVRGASRRR